MKIYNTKQYIEKLKINSVDLEKFNNIKTYKYFPKDKYELIDIVNNKIDKFGNNCDLNDIDVSQIKSFDGLFNNMNEFNCDISLWNVSNAIDMSCMFFGCQKFNKPLFWGKKTFNVESMNGMFYGCDSFNQDISDWDVSNVTTFCGMFYDCVSFNQPIYKWNTKSCKDISLMFKGCNSFNQPIGSWDVSKITDMDYAFQFCRKFNQNLNDWNIVSTFSTRQMFDGCVSLNQPFDHWENKLARLNDMNGMFNDCEMLDQDFSDWDVYEKIFIDMFDGCSRMKPKNYPKHYE